jgi:hypothetical protein
MPSNSVPVTQSLQPQGFEKIPSHNQRQIELQTNSEPLQIPI